MNIRDLGIPIFKDSGNVVGEYVYLEDLKLALDSDVYARIEAKALKEVGGVVPLSWLERQH